MRRAPPVRRHRRHARPGKVAIADAHQPVDGRGRRGDGDGVAVLRDPPRAAVRPLVPPLEPFLRQRRPDKLHLHPLPHVRYRLLNRPPQHPRALLLQLLVLVAVAVQAVPDVERFVPGGVRVDDVLALRRQLRIEHRRDRHEHLHTKHDVNHKSFSRK